MPINSSLLISSPTLQDILVDKTTGETMGGGIITCYQDNSRTTLKNWYYQSGSAGNYSYITLPNPLTLSAAGTITDGNGNDTLPFFYPYSESDNSTLQPYFITIVNSTGTQQFTRQNFPFIPPASAIESENPTLENYIINNRFWRNIGSLNAGTLSNSIIINGSTFYYSTLSPSQHDGFSFPDFIYLKNINGSTETITFNQFNYGEANFIGDIAPEYYLNHNCTGIAMGETLKCYQYPISLRINSIQGQNATFTIQAQCLSGTNTITLSIFQFLGTGVTSQTPIFEQTFTLNSNWKKYTYSFSFPILPNSPTLGTGGDDAYYLQIGMPLSSSGVCNINFTLPSLYFSNVIPTNNFDTYDQIDSIITTPRTGDVKLSLNNSQPSGWVLCNDGIISNSKTSSGSSFTNPSGIYPARRNIDIWPLFNLLWNNFNLFDTGSNSNPIAQMYASNGSATNYGTSAISDWGTKQLQLSSSVGRSLLGIPPLINASYIHGSAPSWNSTHNGYFTVITPISTNLLYVGSPVYFSSNPPSGYTINTIYYSIPDITGITSTTQFQLASSYSNALNGIPVAAGSSDSSSVNINFGLGTPFGQSSHIQLTNELSSHSHLASFGALFFLSGSGSGGSPPTGSNQVSPTTAPTGNSNPFNIVMPSSYMNLFIKL